MRVRKLYSEPLGNVSEVGTAQLSAEYFVSKAIHSVGFYSTLSQLSRCLTPSVTGRGRAICSSVASRVRFTFFQIVNDFF